jgi:putative membrane protein
MPDPHDPRVYFAAERTLLAWVRTSLGLMGMGFVVARFGLFLRMVSQSVPDHAYRPRGLSAAMGIGLVVLGVACAVAAGVQHQRFARTLSPLERPRAYSMTVSLFLAYAIAVAGAGLAVLLAT